MTTISSGTLTQTGSRTYVVGTSSGLDTSALIDTAVAAKTQKADEIDVQIDENTAKISAYDELMTLAEALQDSLENLKSVTGYADEGNMFDSRSGYMESDSSTEATSLLSVAVESGSDLGDYSIVVQQKAQAMKATSDSQSSNADALGYDGSFTIGLENMTAQQIDVTSDMSLDDIAAAINDTTADSGVTASVVKVGEDEYKLVLTGTSTAQEIVVTTVSGDDVMAALGVTDGAGSFQNITQVAQEAIIELDGITITRDDNNFDDVLDGVSLTVENADPGTTITLSIGYDTESTKEAITAFVDAYNALREFVVTNQTVSDDGEVSDDAALFSDTIMEALNSDIASIIADETNSAFATLRDIGISYGDDNYLEIDETTLDEALLDDYTSVAELFSSSYESSSTEFALLSNTSAISSMDLSFDITVDGSGDITAVTVNGESDMFTISGSRIVGKEGTAYEGLSFSYQGTTSTTIDFSLSQGIADRLYNAIEPYADDIDGLILNQKTELEATNEDLEEDAAYIRERAAAYQEQLVDKYAEMEAKIEMLKLLQQQIQAILGTSDDDD